MLSLQLFLSAAYAAFFLFVIFSSATLLKSTQYYLLLRLGSKQAVERLRRVSQKHSENISICHYVLLELYMLLCASISFFLSFNCWIFPFIISNIHSSFMNMNSLLSLYNFLLIRTRFH